MPYSLKRLLYLVPFAILCGCNSGGDDYTAYFGGEIQNPTSPYVVFSRDNVPLDTIKLDKNNRFFIKFDSLTPGLYSFQHEPEYQYVYFDKNDSIMVSLNADNFDNSVVFSGRGDRKNNFLMELHLQNEKDRAASFAMYDRDYPSFKKSIDSAYALRKQFYNRRKEAIKWSEGFDLFARTRTDMSYFTKKEYYPVVHARRTGNDIRGKLPADFYAYRSEIDFGDHQLSHFSPFARYLNALLTNMAATRDKGRKIGTEDLLQDNIARLDIADSLFKDEHLRNEVLNNIAFSFLLENQKSGDNHKFLDRYMELSTDRSPRNEVRKIAVALNRLKPGMQLPSIALTDLQGNAPDFSSAKKQTVLLFWTSCARNHMEIVAQKIRQLQKEFPDVAFVAVNVDEEKEWRQAVSAISLPDVLQLRAGNFKELKSEWAFTRINKAIVLMPGGKIRNAFGNLMEPGFAALLK